MYQQQNGVTKMSTWQLIKSLRSFEKGLINGYFTINFAANIPCDIINLCSLYLFILDEFDSESALQCNISGLNNTVASFKNTNESTIKMAKVFTHQKIKPTGKYHWQLSISSFNGKNLEFGFVNNHLPSGHFRIKPCPSQRIIDIYLDTDNKTISINTQYYRDQKQLAIDHATGEFQFFINAFDTQAFVIELLQYDNSNHYIHILSKYPQHITSNIGYAQCIFNSNDKIKHYEIALKQFPYVESWNDAYLECLIDNKQREQAYKHALKYKKGVNSIAKLINYYARKEKNEYGHNLSSILTDEQLVFHDLCFQAAYCSGVLGHYKHAVKYYQMFCDQHCTDDNEEMKDNINVCIGNMANIYYFDFDDDKKALELYLKLNEKELARRKFNAKIGSCYYKFKEY
eukprot:284378_1